MVLRRILIGLFCAAALIACGGDDADSSAEATNGDESGNVEESGDSAPTDEGDDSGAVDEGQTPDAVLEDGITSGLEAVDIGVEDVSMDGDMAVVELSGGSDSDVVVVCTVVDQFVEEAVVVVDGEENDC